MFLNKYLCDGGAGIITETRVADSISELSVARIVVSHHPETLARADRVYVIDKGVLHLVHDRASELHGAIAP